MQEMEGHKPFFPFCQIWDGWNRIKICQPSSYIPIGHKLICESIQNIVDKGMQSSEFGPDLFDPEVPLSPLSGEKDEFDFDTLKLTNKLNLQKKHFSRMAINWEKEQIFNVHNQTMA